VHVSFGRLTENAIPKTPVQNSVRCILAQLILVEKHGQHLGKKSLARDKSGQGRKDTKVQPRRSSRKMERGDVRRETWTYDWRHQDSFNIADHR
jgi:hypothetical protein